MKTSLPCCDLKTVTTACRSFDTAVRFTDNGNRVHVKETLRPECKALQIEVPGESIHYPPSEYVPVGLLFALAFAGGMGWTSYLLFGDDVRALVRKFKTERARWVDLGLVKRRDE